MNLTTVELGNFKRFEKLSVDTSADITLLLGPNSSGKSSVIKSLLALKQTILPSNESEGLATQGDYVDLGTYQDFVFNHQRRNRVLLGTSFVSTLGESAIPFRFTPMIRSEADRSSARSFSYVPVFDYNSITEQPRVYSVLIKANIDGIEPPLELSIRRKKTRNAFTIRVNKEFLNAIADRSPRSIQKFRHRWLSGLSVAHDNRLSFRRIAPAPFVSDFPISWMLQFQSRFVDTLANSLFYLGPIRSAPSRNYVRTSHSRAVGPRGEYTASVLANLEKRQKKVTKGSSPLQSQYSFLKKALNILFPGKGFTPQTIQELVRVEFFDLSAASMPRRRGESIMDVGYGFSQIFPVLVQLAVMPRGSTLVVEQPELHLHPLAQSRLAEVFRLAVTDGKRIIAETHSDHLIRGLQLQVSQRKKSLDSGLSRNQVKILYTPEDASEPRTLEMDDAGEFLEPWPTGFMDIGYQTLSQVVANKLS